MSSPETPVDLLDLKFLPAWVNEPAGSSDYSGFEGEEAEARPRDRGPRPPRRGPDRTRTGAKEGRRDRPHGKAKRDDLPRGREPRREERPAPPPNVAISFIPHAASLANVIVQIKSGSVAYSVYALARLFLEKPERYHVKLVAPTENPLFRLGESGAISTDRRSLENNAFSSAKDEFYQIDVVQSEPLKGNFSNVARCRLSGTLLGPTNHHSYQAQLRNLYEQRFSRRMSFVDYQRQVEIVSDPAAVEQWKEQARNVTTFTTRGQEQPVSFTNVAEVERHFRQNYLPTLVREAPEFIIDGVLSRRLGDRALGRLIEDTWSHEARSPTHMMQELAGAFRQAGLNIFRHRRGMLFVSPIRSRPFVHELAGVSPMIASIFKAISAAPGINRKDLAEQLVATASEDGQVERSKLTLASDLKWLVSEGYVIEFNDGSLDLPRGKKAQVTGVEKKPDVAAEPASAEAAKPNEKAAGEVAPVAGPVEPTVEGP